MVILIFLILTHNVFRINNEMMLINTVQIIYIRSISKFETEVGLNVSDDSQLKTITLPIPMQEFKILLKPKIV